MKTELILAELPSTCDLERLIVVLVRSESGASKVSLRQQSWCDRLGWYDQKSLDLEPAQVRQLRSVFGTTCKNPRREPVQEQISLPFPGLGVESA